MIKTIHKGWLHEMENEINVTKDLKIISPFVTLNVVKKFMKAFRGDKVKLITRYNLNDFKSGVSSLNALKYLVSLGCEIKGIKNLHSKTYIFDKRNVFITSANFTSGGFFNNKEFGISSNDSNVILESIRYFESLWSIESEILTNKQIIDWQSKIDNSSTTKKESAKLPDLGASEKDKILKGRKYFIKFFGTNEHRANLEHHSRNEIEYGCSHYALSFSKKVNNKRPRKYRDGDIVFMARMLEGNDYAIYGRGVTYAHKDKRDIVGTDDINHVSWLADWPILVRVHSTKFIDSTMGDCPKLGEMIDNLDYESFDKTLKKHINGRENINPWNSLRQQADVQLSNSGALWIEKKFEAATNNNGIVPNGFINKFYGGISL